MPYLDTIQTSFQTIPALEMLAKWNNEKITHPDGRVWNKYYINEYVDSEIVIKATYYPRNPSYKEPRFMLEFSLPKMLFGNNIEMITNSDELKEAILIANDLIQQKKKIPGVDISAGILCRMDVCYNHQVGNRVHDYITAFLNLHYPHRKTQSYQNQGVQYKSKIATTKFYCKETQTKNPLAKGILRQETTYRKPFRIGKALNCRDPKLEDITKDKIISLLRADLEKLRLKDNLICDRELARNILVSVYNRVKGERLYGFLITRQTMSKGQIIEEGTALRTIQRDEKLIADAGVSLTMTEKVPLPPLCIESEIRNCDVK
jgi:hypothetical protein